MDEAHKACEGYPLLRDYMYAELKMGPGAKKSGKGGLPAVTHHLRWGKLPEDLPKNDRIMREWADAVPSCVCCGFFEDIMIYKN